MQTTQYGPRVELFPGFREDQIKRLEEKTAHMPEGVRQQSQQELYRQLLPKVMAKQWKEQRMGAKNEFYQKNLQKPSEQRQVGELQLKQEDLADMIKGHFGLRHDLPTEETMQGFQSLMQEEGVEEQLLLDYLNGNGEELLYKTGLKEKGLAKKRDDQKDGLFGPLVRAGSAVAGAAGGALGGIWDNWKDTAGDIKRIANDPKKGFGDKFAEVLLGELVIDGVVGSIGSGTGGGLAGLVKGFTNDQEKQRVSRKVQNIMGKILKKETVHNLVEGYKSLNSEEKQELEDLLEHATNALDLAGLSSLATQPVKSGVKSGLKTAIQGVKATDDLLEASVKGVKAMLNERGAKEAVKHLDANKEEALKVAGRVLQGDVEAQKIGYDVLKSLDTKGVKSYKELYERMDMHGKELVRQVDDELGKQNQTFTFWDNLVAKEVETPGGTKKIVESPISDGIEQLKELYQQVGDQISLVKMEGLEEKFAKEGLSLKEMNDLARQYSSEFGQKAFTKMGDPKTSVSAELYESQRKAMKEFVRENMPDDTIKNLDRAYSQVAESKIHVEKMVEKVNDLAQKLKQRNLIEKTAYFAGEVIDKLTGGGIKAFITKFLPSNVGNKINNAIDMEKELPKLLKQLDSLGAKIDAGEIKKADLEKIGKNLPQGEGPTSVDLSKDEPRVKEHGNSSNDLNITKNPENANQSYTKTDGTVVNYKNYTNIEEHGFRRRQFSNKHQLALTDNLKPKTQLVDLIKVGELKKGTLAQVPEIAFNDGKARPLEFTSETYAKIFQKHGPFSHENLIATANDWDYMIKNLNGTEGHINLIKELPDGSALLLGAKRKNGAFVTTHFEPTKSLEKVLKDAKTNGGEVIEKGFNQLREGAETKGSITLYRGLKEGGQKKFSFDAYTDSKKVAKGYGEKIITEKISPKKLADFSNPSDELLQIIKDNRKGAEWYDLERLRGVATAEKFSMGTNMYEIFDDANVREALKNKGYDYVKFNDFGKDFTPHATYFSLKSIDAHKISKLIGNSLENNYNGVKPNRLDGEKLSIKEAETLLTKSGKNLNERIMIGIDQAGNLVLEDGRHLLEAYRTLGKEIPESKLGFVNDKAKKLFSKLYSK